MHEPDEMEQVLVDQPKGVQGVPAEQSRRQI